ncbi:MAG: PadR family transcriptional regulator [Micromonosporaceae bacterium]
MDDDLGRWADPSLLVMTSLAAGPKHGYAIMQDVESESGVRLGPGTLYGVISRLEQRGLIEPLAAQDRRRPYKITAEGSRVLAAQLRRMRSLAETGLGRLETGLGTLGWVARAAVRGRAAVKGMA